MANLVKMASTPLSVCIITKNEQEKMSDCLKSVAWAQEVIVVDDFSSDDTSAICHLFKNVRYLTHKFEGFGFQKNYAVSQARYDWILNLDADEVVTKELQEEILNAIVNKTEFSGFRIRRKNLWFGKYAMDGYPGALRLFNKKNGNFRLDYVHEKLDISGEIGQLERFLLHHPKSYQNFKSHYKIYVLKYGKLAAKDYLKRKERVTFFNVVWKIILLPFLVFVRGYFLKRNFLRGKTGLYTTFCSAMCYHKAYLYLLKFQIKAGFENVK